ncbi:MAG TPA: CaiB/BaiF CoA-transferase family protein [Jatrophihabitans sp.]|nr:CaiB/BaiF CoA-transferase family protein [Jatrophihabitans sp.]
MDASDERGGPLTGIQVVELGGIGPGPFCGMILGDLGADVIRVDRPTEAGQRLRMAVLHRNRRSIAVDLKQPDGVAAILRLIERADVVIEGFRPGVTERLGLGPDVCLSRNPGLVYGRMTGWGQDGPLAREPGHDINYLGLAGALAAIGSADGDPVVPLNLVADMGGGGLLLALGVLSALLAARSIGRGQVVDAAMTDGVALQLSLVYSLIESGVWTDRRGANLFDGAAPFYRAYRCADGRHVAVGALEPQFYAALLRVLGLHDDPLFSKQHDRSAWLAMGERLQEVFATRTRDDWATAFAGQQACVTPVLGLVDAAQHPHNAERGTFLVDAGAVAPAPAPRFLGTPASTPQPAPLAGEHTPAVLTEAGLTADEIADLLQAGVVR